MKFLYAGHTKMSAARTIGVFLLDSAGALDQCDAFNVARAIMDCEENETPLDVASVEELAKYHITLIEGE